MEQGAKKRNKCCSNHEEWSMNIWPQEKWVVFTPLRPWLPAVVLNLSTRRWNIIPKKYTENNCDFFLTKNRTNQKKKEKSYGYNSLFLTATDVTIAVIFTRRSSHFFSLNKGLSELKYTPPRSHHLRGLLLVQRFYSHVNSVKIILCAPSYPTWRR